MFFSSHLTFLRTYFHVLWRASKAGKKGGEQSYDRQHDQEGESGRTQQGGGNIADDPKRASDAGKKGGPR